jgi:hypothetical protein
MTRIKYFFLFGIPIILLILTSCTPGKRTARSFVNQRDKVSVMIVPPAEVFLYHYPLDNPGQDPENLENSILLMELDKERSMELFTRGLKEGLEILKLQTFTPEQRDLFLSQKGDKYIFRTAQTEIIETDSIFVDRAFVDNIAYTHDLLIRMAKQNSWFEFVAINANQDTGPMQVLFSTIKIADRIIGDFRYNRNWEVYYQYQIKSISSEDIYNLSFNTGRRNARYIFEFLMNREVELRHGKVGTGPDYFKYWPNTNKITISRDSNRFVILEPEEILIEENP